MQSLDAATLFDLGPGAFALPVWAAGALAALFAFLCVVAFRRPAPLGIAGTLARSAAVLIGALLVMSFLDHSALQQRSAERLALDARSAELTARSLIPGSPLACLDAGAGEAIESACEKAIFAKPETAAAAVGYITARLALLADGLDFAVRADRGYEGALNGLRRAIELDRYGIAAHVLATRDGCVADDCAAFALMRDASTLKANLKARAFDTYVARYASSWSEPAPAPVVEKNPPVAVAPAAAGPVAVAPPLPAVAPSARVDFPSAASIPPVSIMNAEPKLPSAPGPASGDDAAEPPAAAAAAPAKKPPVPPRRPQNQAAAPPAR